MKNNSVKNDECGSITDSAVRSALRSFSGRISHDFNNMLTMLMAYPQLIRRDLPENSQGNELLSVMESNAELMAGISARLSKFAAITRLSSEPADLDAVVSEIVTDITEEKISDGISIIMSVQSGSRVSIPRSTLGMIITEVLINASENLGGSGKITVETDLFKPQNALVCQGGRVPVAEYVRIRISDNGGGVPEDDINRLVEPFFSLNKTTRARGSGLGLSMVFAAVNDCGGYLVIENDKDGLSVSMLFREYGKRQISDTAESKNAADVSPSNTDDKHRILVVDDEEDIVSLFKLMLGEEINNVFIDVARNGREAIDKFKNGRHDVIIMDLHMPVMDGHEAFNKLEKMCQAEKIKMPGMVFCTGYIPPQGIREAVEKNSSYAMLQKPVSIQSLIKAVKNRLPAS